MALRGKLSTAHEYNANNQCIYCDMYKSNVELLNHVCIPAREKIADSLVQTEEEQKEEVKNG